MIKLKENVIIYIIIIGLISMLFIQRSCNNKQTSVTTITVPSKTGTFEKVIPKPIPLTIEYKDSIVYKDKVISLTNPVDKKLAEDYLKAKDSITRLNLYISSIQIRKYKQVLSNKDIDLTIEAETTGTLNYLIPTYTIKERELKTPSIVKQTVFAAYIGGGISVATPTLKPEFFANAGFQNKRGDIILGGYGSNGTIEAKYILRILNIKK